MKRSKSAPRPLYETLDWMLVRAPLLPVETYLGLSNSTNEDEAREGSIDPDTLEDGSLVPRDPRVRRAIAVGSSDLLEALERSKPTGRNAAELEGKLLRYLIRMSTRPTPYGLFAGVALAQWGPTTDLALAETPPRTRTRPDMAWLLNLVLELESQPEVRRELRFFANPGAFVHAGRVFLAERAPARQPSPASAVSVRATGVVQRALAVAREPIPHQDLVAELLSTTPGARKETADAGLESLASARSVRKTRPAWIKALGLAKKRSSLRTSGWASRSRTSFRSHSISGRVRVRGGFSASARSVAGPHWTRATPANSP